MLRLIRNLIVILALIVGVAFGFYNRQPVDIDLLFVRAQAPLVLLLAAALVAGFLVGFVVCLPRLYKLRRRLSRSERAVKKNRLERDEHERATNRSTPPSAVLASDTSPRVREPR